MACETFVYTNDIFFLENMGDLNIGDVSHFDTVYEINGQLFRENNFENNNIDYCEFQLDGLETCSGEEGTDETYFNVTIQEVRKGILINSSILLSHEQWNTLVPVDEAYLCLVCDEIASSIFDHIRMKVHEENLEKYKPLKKFEYSVTRMIDKKYHCAVCNNIFETDHDASHFHGENHKNNMLHALNRALRINTGENHEDFDGNLTNGIYESNGISENNGIYENNATSDYENSEGFHDDDCGSDGFNGTKHKKFSYVSTTTEPYVVPEFISQVIGHKTLNVPYNSWHMIITPWNDKFYCMTCKVSDDISKKTEHCMKNEHLQKLKKYRVVEKYDCFLMRQIDSVYYHCAQCNDLVLISDVDVHIFRAHEKKLQNTRGVISTKTDVPNQPNIDSINGCNIGSYESPKNKSMNQSKMFRELLEINNVSPGIENDIILDVFKWKFRISFMSYNTIIKEANGKRRLCALCDLSFHKNDIVGHISNHLRDLKSIPYDERFGYNLIRWLSEKAHCSICNMTFLASSTVDHVSSTRHLALLCQARNTIPTATENTDEPKTDLNPTMHQTKTDSQEMRIESNQNVETLIDTVESLDNYDFEFIYLNFKNTYFKITFNSYNSLVVIGDGTRFCFVCSVRVVGCLKTHIESTAHTDCVKKCKFIDKYEKHLLRQMFLTYHCCICNQIFSKKYLNLHISRPLELGRPNKNTRKNDLKSGIKAVHAETHNELIYLDMQEPEIKILCEITIQPKSNISIKKESKIVKVDSKVFKICWDSWQGLTINKNSIYCNICNEEYKEYGLNSHINNASHSGSLENHFDRKYYPNLIRKINDKTANCVICNLFLSNKNHIILEHLNGKKHKVNYNNANKTNDYDCNDNVLHL